MDTSARIKADEIKIAICRNWYQSFPAATKVWIALKSKVPMDFIITNWEKIIS